MKEGQPVSGEDSKNQKTSLKLSDSEVSWSLCGVAEQRGENSLNQGLFVVVNDLLVVKLIGKMSGVAVKTAEAEDGERFVRGYWYSPLDSEVRESIRRNFVQGVTRQELPETDWMEIRLVRDEKLLMSAEKAERETPLLTKFRIPKWKMRKKLLSLREEYTGQRVNLEPSA